MSSVNLASALVASKQAQVQVAAAAKIAKFNANAEAAVGDLVEAAANNLQKLASSTTPGLGQNLDISA